MPTAEKQLEDQFVEKLKDLEYEHRLDICDGATLEKSLRVKFQSLNRVHLTDKELELLLTEIVTPYVFTAACTLRKRSTLHPGERHAAE